MKIKEIKISNEIMDALVKKFFTTKIIEEEKMWSDVKFVGLPEKIAKLMANISIKDIRKYCLENNKMEPFDSPYFSFVSSNSLNDLQVYMRQANDGKVTFDDFECRTYKFIKEDGKYFFTNPREGKNANGKKTIKPLTLVKWDYDSLPEEWRKHNKKELFGKKFMCFGEVVGMPGHSYLQDIKTGVPTILHTFELIELTEEEL